MTFGFSLITLFLNALLGGGSVDLAALVGPELYWQHVAGERPADAVLITYAAPPDEGRAEAPDISGLIEQLGAAEYEKRQAAADKIRAHGAAVAPQLKQATRHDDPEIAVQAEKLHAEMSGQTEGWPLKRLMAIRTLGADKVEQALPTLKKLTDDDEPFIAEAAQKAIARITGKAYDRPTVTDAELAADLALLPTGCNIVGQVRGGDRPGPTLKALFADATFPNQGETIARHRARAAEEVVEIIERVGNLRIDAVTLGVKGNPDNGGAAVLVVRGLCDPEAFGGFLADEARSKKEVEGTTVYSADDDSAIALRSPRRLVAVMAEQEKTLESTLRAALKTAGEDAPAPKLGQPIMALIKSVDRKAANPWIVADIDNTIYQRTPFTAPFKTMVLTGERGEEGAMAIRLRAEGEDAEKIAAVVERFEAGRKMVLKQMEPMAKQMPAIAEIREDIAAMKVRQPAGKPRVEVELKMDDGAPVMMMPMFWMGAANTPEPQPARPVDQAEPVQNPAGHDRDIAAPAG